MTERRVDLGDTKPGMVTINGVPVRIRRYYGVATPPFLWDVMDGGRVVETFASAPSGDDVSAAVARARSGITREMRIAEAYKRALAGGKRETAIPVSPASTAGRRGRPSKRTTI